MSGIITVMNESYAEYIRKHQDNKSIKEIAEALGISCTEVRTIYEAHFKEWEKSDIEKANNQHLGSKAKPVVGFPIECGESIWFESAYAAESEGFHAALIYACINGHIKFHKGYVWRYAEEKVDVEKLRSNAVDSRRKAVVGFHLAGGEPIRFESAYAAQLQGFFTAGIRACIKGKIKQYKGYVWRYTEEEKHD